MGLKRNKLGIQWSMLTENKMLSQPFLKGISRRFWKKCWYFCNDHLSDRSTFQIRLTSMLASTTLASRSELKVKKCFCGCYLFELHLKCFLLYSRSKREAEKTAGTDTGANIQVWKVNYSPCACTEMCFIHGIHYSGPGLRGAHATLWRISVVSKERRRPVSGFERVSASICRSRWTLKTRVTLQCRSSR